MKKKSLINSLRKQKFPDKIIKAFEKINRQDFIPKELKSRAYEDLPLGIGYGQTISQPYTIAFMLTLLELRDNLKILEVGSGSGYVLALIDQISKNSSLYGIERIKELAEKSKKVLGNKQNIKIIHGNGYKGLNKYQPFDRIIVSAAADEVPQELVNQLNLNGLMVIPIINSIYKIIKQRGQNRIVEYPSFVFVPLIK